MADWLVVLLAAAGGVAALIVGTRSLLARRHYHTSETTLVCPRTGAPVRCRLVVDGRSEESVEVAHCSLLPGGRPTCEQDCVKLLNLGIRLAPLEPARPPRTHERADAGEPGAGEEPGPPSP
ncbi:hypothetical protein WME97_10345 [Sorangium sp. So ce367]|uniref:hypothetical protein n=1 Tax=Sorangium sp. So ce367 TaxID=3133305 RepID=UPI003F621CE4